jgi:hemerythrin superfamily protein
MSILDKVISAVTPLESDQAREEARNKALSAATPNGWLSMVIQHHRDIERAFAGVQAASTAAAQMAAQKELAVLLTGHSIAEEAVLYPALVGADEKANATTAYTQQSAAKMELGLLETLTPLSQEYKDKLEHIRGAVLHHVYEEENTWFFELQQKLSEADKARLAVRYKEEFNRYVNGAVEPAYPRAAAGR